MTGFVPKKSNEITYTSRMKSYPDGSFEVMAADSAVFRREGWEERKSGERARVSRAVEQGNEVAGGTPAADQERSMRRAAARLRDLALCNDFRWFVTLTLDPTKIDRHSMEALTRVLNRWADNRVRRKGLRYVLVPERHKDGAIHLHGFFNDVLPLVDSGTISRPGGKPRKPRSEAQAAQWLAEGGKRVYNIPDWSLGFSTALELTGDYHAAVAYVCKYVRKQREKIGGRWYYSGGKLEDPTISYADISYREVEALEGSYTFSVPGRAFAVYRGFGKGEEHCGKVDSGDSAARCGVDQAGKGGIGDGE